MIVEKTNFESLLAISAMGKPSPVHKYEGKFFGLASIGRTTYLIYTDEGPETPFVEYDLRTREWRPVDPKADEFTGDPNSAIVPIIDIKELSGDTGEEIKGLL